MAQTYKDPHSYLNESLVKRGKSGHYGVHLSHVAVVAESEADYGYRVSPSNFDLLSPFEGNYNNVEWVVLLVTLRSQLNDNQGAIVVGQTTYQFLPDGGHLSLNVFLPETSVETFDYEILSAQSILKGVAKFVGKIPTTIRFNLGLVFKSYGTMAEQGEVQEIEFSY
jgi:hypothetical protein